MNLWDIKNGQYCEELLQLVSGSEDTVDLVSKLGEPDFDQYLGTITSYFVKRYGFSESCVIAPSTGDNPATILALPLRPLDAIVSLGTSTTFLMSTPQYKPDPSVHFFNHPTTSGLYMFMYASRLAYVPDNLFQSSQSFLGCATRMVVSRASKSETRFPHQIRKMRPPTTLGKPLTTLRLLHLP